MKKLICASLATLCLGFGFFVSLQDSLILPKTEPVMYIAAGWYYTCGEVVTENGNIWGYSQDIISEQPSYDNEPVLAVFYDAGTPDNIYDDEIVGLVFNGDIARAHE